MFNLCVLHRLFALQAVHGFAVVCDAVSGARLYQVAAAPISTPIAIEEDVVACFKTKTICEHERDRDIGIWHTRTEMSGLTRAKRIDTKANGGLALGDCDDESHPDVPFYSPRLLMHLVKNS